MRSNIERLLVTGGSGFLGSTFIRLAATSGVAEIVNVDALTYAADERRVRDVPASTRLSTVRADVADREAIHRVFDRFDPEAVVHFAAESHVTRSESSGSLFWRTNVEGTRCVLEAASEKEVDRFVHISTDEVYGPIDEGEFTEGDKRPGAATSPYARSKAAADDLAMAAAAHLPVSVVRPANAFGPWQFPEKALPRWITRGLRGQPLLVWGDGGYVRQWLYSEDLAAGVWKILCSGESGAAYNVGPSHEPEITNLALARWIAAKLNVPSDRVQRTAYDRPNHDRRYGIDSSRARTLGWSPGDVFEQFASTVSWYRDNEWWWRSHIRAAEEIYSDEATAIHEEPVVAGMA